MSIGTSETSDPEKAVALLAAVVASSDDAIISKTLEGIILTWNAGAGRLYGYLAAETIGRRMTLVLPDDREDEEAEILRPIGQGERVEHFETVRRTKSGELIDVSLTISPIRDKSGQIVGASHVARDITDRKRFDERLHHLAAVVESSEDAIVSKTLDGTILTWNAGAERLYGYPAAETIGRRMTLVLPDDRADEEAEILRRIGLGERVEHFETVRRTKSGESVDVSLTISPIRDKSGRIVGASHVARNISDRKQLESSLLQAQKLESIGLLAGGIAHDFNNLLVGILGGASFALETTSSSHPAYGMLQTIVTSAERAAHLTRQMLAYAGKGTLLVEPIDLSEVVAQTKLLLSASIPKSVELKLQLEERLPVVQSDAGQIQQVVMNLIINAVEAVDQSSKGSVIARTRAEDIGRDAGRRDVFGNSLQPGLYAVFEVEDTGPGVDAAILAKIFDPFFTTKFTGRGLGLAAVYGVVRSHRGAIEVETDLGNGSTFRVCLPARYAPRSRDTTPTSVEPAGRGTETVLVIDDEAVVRNFAEVTLNEAGYRAIVAESGEQGLEFVRNRSEISLVLLDMSMPGMGGREVLEELTVLRPQLPVVICSGYSEMEVCREFSGLEMAGILEKPFTTKRFNAKVRVVLDMAAREEGKTAVHST
jgi:PAS domain S-box-containing protein